MVARLLKSMPATVGVGLCLTFLMIIGLVAVLRAFEIIDAPFLFL